MAKTAIASRQFGFTDIVTPPDITADQIAYAPAGLDTAGGWLQGSDTHDRVIRSLAGGYSGRILPARNIGSSRMIISHDDAAETTVTNRFTIAGTRGFIWYPSQSILLWYANSRWRILGTHEQQRVITPAAISTNQIDWQPADASTGFDSFVADTIRASSTAAVRIGSLLGAYAYRVIAIHNVGSNPIVLTHEDTTGGVTAAARFNFGGHDQIIWPEEVLQIVYDPTTARWRCLGNLKPFKVYARTTSTLTLANSTATQKLFNVSANGAIALPGDSTFKFKCQFDVTGMSTTPGNLRFNLLGAGTATLSAIKYTSYGLDNNTPTNATTLSGLLSNASASAVAIATAGTGTAMFANIEGTFSITGAAGTIIPSVALLTAVATAVVSTGAYIEIERIGAGTPVPIGIWS